MTLTNVSEWAVIAYGIIVPLLLVLNLFALFTIGGNVVRINKMMTKAVKTAEVKPVAAAPANVPITKVENKDTKAVKK